MTIDKDKLYGSSPQQSNSYHYALAADEADSFGEEVVDFFTHGIPAAITSGVVGTLNTGIAFGNMFGADAEEINVAQKFQDWGWENTGNYYEEHKGAIDAVGFGLSAIVPGMIGIKAARLAQAGLAARNSTSMLARGLSKALVPAKTAERYLESVQKGATTFNNFKAGIQATKQGMHQQFVEAAFAETAILLTNANNTAITKEGTAWHEAVLDNAGGWGFGVVLGGGIGGAIDSVVQFQTIRKIIGTEQAAVNMGAPVKDLTPWGSMRGSNIGDNISEMFHDYGLAKAEARKYIDEGANVSAVQKAQDHQYTSEFNIKLALAALTGEYTGKVKPTTLKDIKAPLAGRMFERLAEETPEKAASILANASRINRYSDEDMLFNPSAGPLVFAKEAEWTKALQERGNLTPQQAQGSKGARGISIGFPAEKRANVNLVKSDDVEDIIRGVKSEDEFVFTVRHELGHDNANRLNTYFKSDNPYAKAMSAQAERVSRMARPRNWEAVDRLPELERQMAAATKAGTPIPADLMEEFKRAKNAESYMRDPHEMLADSWAMFNRSQDDFVRLSKENPTLYKVMKQNAVLKQMVGKKEALLDIDSFDMFKVTERAPTVGDVGNISYNERTGTVTYGKDANAGVVETMFHKSFLNLKAKQFNVLEVRDPLEASANYYAANKTSIKLNPEKVIPWTDFASLSLLHKQAKEGLIGQYKVLHHDGTEILLDFGDTELAEAATNLAEFEDYFMGLKKEAITRIRNQRIPTKAQEKAYVNTKGKVPLPKGTSLDVSEIARITDTSESFAEVSGALENVNGRTPFWSQKYDPARPTVVKIQYDVKRELADKNNIEALNEVQQRIATQSEANYTNGVNYFQSLDTRVTDQAPLPTTLTANRNNFAQSITQQDEVKSMLTSTNADYGSGLEHAVAISQMNNTGKQAITKHIDRYLAAPLQMIKNDNEALLEATILDTTLRRGWYHFAPTTAEELDSIIQNAIVPNKAIIDLDMRIAKVKEILMPAIESNAKNGTPIWNREIKSQIGTVLNSKRLDQGILDKLGTNATDGFKTIRNKHVANMWQKKVQANAKVIEAKKVAGSMHGYSVNLDPEALYPGAFNTTKYPHRMFVIPKVKGLYGSSKGAMIAGNTPEELVAKVNAVKAAYGEKVTIKSATEIESDAAFKGLLDEDLVIDEVSMNSTLQRKGIAFDAVPDLSPDLMDQYRQDMLNQGKGAIDAITEGMYGEEIATLRAQSEALNRRIRLDRTSTRKSVKDPYQESIELMLNSSKEANPSKWRTNQQEMDKALSQLVNTLTGSLRASTTTLKYEQMNALMKEHNLPIVFDKQATQNIIKTSGANPQILAGLVPQVNGIAATMMLRFMEVVQPMVTAFSTPIMAVPEMKHLLKAIPELKQKQLAESLSQVIPESSHRMPSNAKLMYQSVKDFFSKPELVQDFRDKGFVTNIVQEVRESINDISIDPELLKQSGGIGAIRAGAGKLVDVASAPADYMEGMVKFVAARMADLALEAGGVSKGHLRDMAIGTYVKRVNGNYQFGQRPQLFQGFAGQAIGLFQTYQFNMIQQLMRHVGDKQKGAASAMVALQAGIFGAQSLPGFAAINQHIGERSQEGNDFYTGTKDLLGDDVSEWLLYGLSSNLTIPMMGDSLALYTRGDVNPRSPILLPTSMAEIPAINITTKFVSNLLDTVDNLGGDTSVSHVFAEALAKNGVNRPLQGIGQALIGAKTTSKGSLLTSLQDVDLLTRFARITGTSTLNESIAIQGYYRAKGYETYRQEQLRSLGESVKSRVQAGEFVGDAYMETMTKYTKLGGNIDSFDRWSHNQFMGATESSIMSMYKSNTSPTGRYLQNLMGGDISQVINPYFTPPTDTIVPTAPVNDMEQDTQGF